MKRGDVWWLELGSTAGGEIRKSRPAVIVSNNAANRYLNRVQVVPLTSSVGKPYPSESYVLMAGVRNKAMADQLMTVSKSRLLRKITSVSVEEMVSLERALKTHLGLR